MRLFEAVILENTQLAPSIFNMRVKVPNTFRAVPGQFVNIYLNRPDMLLPRPISICGLEEDTLRLVYQIAGKGTGYMAGLGRWELLRIAGPLGNGFNIASSGEGMSGAGLELLIGGGIGAAPLLFLARRLKPAMVILGFRSASSVILAGEFLSLGWETVVSTDDGSVGYHGRVTDAARDLTGGVKTSAIYVCGPRIMLKKAAEYAAERSIPCHVAMEERMGCGIGACLCCPAPVIGNGSRTYKKVCKDGPVFDADSIAWEELS
ncbi:MAG: dihydroorotate dehydrogenase electron transfer subunit [Clostridiales bacterium]|jgi:dihydroorotate dehydrogenase electron transfer subunit|nr:dihydroorotate dehydrogenase electron transfer subunit [Clostridiales bacterium]